MEVLKRSVDNPTRPQTQIVKLKAKDLVVAVLPVLMRMPALPQTLEVSVDLENLKLQLIPNRIPGRMGELPVLFRVLRALAVVVVAVSGVVEDILGRLVVLVEPMPKLNLKLTPQLVLHNFISAVLNLYLK